MKMKTVHVVAAFVMVAVFAVSVQAAFMVEVFEDGLATDHFAGSYRPSGSPSPSDAFGVTASNSVYGGKLDPPDTYVYSYSPGDDGDNLPVPLIAGDNLGAGNFASGLPGGNSGLYNVYITWPESTNVLADNVKITVTYEGGEIIVPVVNQKTFTAGDDPPGSNTWLLIASSIPLEASGNYTVTQEAIVDGWTSMRGHGVMWEAAVPEPMTLMLLGVGGLFLRRRR